MFERGSSPYFFGDRKKEEQDEHEGIHTDDFYQGP